MLVNVEMLNVWSFVEVEEEFSVVDGDLDDLNLDGSGVYEIRVGCRGTIDEIVKCDVVDGMFVVNSESDIIEKMGVDCDEEFVSSYVMEKGLRVNKNMYFEGWFEESASCYVRVEV